MCRTISEAFEKGHIDLSELIEQFLRNRIDMGQAEYEMCEDGYNGDIESYIHDYKGDYEVVLDGKWAYIHRKGYDEYYEVDGNRRF